jgi:hypothetical protein
LYRANHARNGLQFDDGVQPVPVGRKALVGKVAIKVVFDAGQVFQVPAFAITPVQPYENSQDFGCPLGSHDCVAFPKTLLIKPLWQACSAFDVVINDLFFKFWRYIDPCVLRQGRNIVGAWANKRVLKIYDADASGLFAFRNPDYVWRMKIPKNKAFLMSARELVLV